MNDRGHRHPFDYAAADEPQNAAAEPETDPRVASMQRLVDAEKRAHYARREVERKQKEAAIAFEELEQARSEMHNLLGIGTANEEASKW